MCGILSVISLNNNELLRNDQEFEFALNMMEHRGPDASCSVYESNVHLGHSRLSIIDLDEASNQPFYSDCGRYVIVFNGEIYNYREIKQELSDKGYKFRTQGDTEVLLYSLIEYGREGVQNFIGMFSFVFCDLKTNQYLIFRDRLGVKPLFYSIEDNRIIICSEVRPITQLVKNLRFNESALISYVSYRYPILDDTFFDNIKSLPPGHYMSIDNQGSINVEKYWSLQSSICKSNEDLGEEYYLEKLRKILCSAVSYRMVSDVEVGSFLSGGVDSSAITALMSIQTTKPVNSFTIGFEDKSYQEFDYAKEVAERYSTKHTEITIEASTYIESMSHLIELKGAPLSVPNEVALYLMSKEMKKSISVVLSGEGADEIFGGYGRIHRSTYDYERVMEIMNKQCLSDKEQEFISKCKKKYGEKLFSSEVEHFIINYEYMSFEEKRKLFSNRDLLVETESKILDKFQSVFDEANTDNYLNKMLYVFEMLHLPGLLQRVDSATMAASIEARVPFVDHRLVEFAFSIPNKYKLKWKDKKASAYLLSDEISEVHDIPKYILKKGCEDILSNNILYRKKMGFPVPLNNWFGGEFRQYAKEMLLSNNSKVLKYFNKNEIVRMLDDDDLVKQHHKAMKVWNIINVEIFLNTYFNEGMK